jgi:hypothetical protein
MQHGVPQPTWSCICAAVVVSMVALRLHPLVAGALARTLVEQAVVAQLMALAAARRQSARRLSTAGFDSCR